MGWDGGSDCPETHFLVLECFKSIDILKFGIFFVTAHGQSATNQPDRQHTGHIGQHGNIVPGADPELLLEGGANP